MRPEWKDFVGGLWEKEVNVRDFIQKNHIFIFIIGGMYKNETRMERFCRRTLGKRS